MGLLSYFKKDQQVSAADAPEFTSRAEDASRAVRGRGKKSSAKNENTADDPLLPQKKRARRRLIGAIALVIAVVIGLPMVLDSEPKPLADDVVIQIPSKDKVSAPVLPPSEAGLPTGPAAGADPVSDTPVEQKSRSQEANPSANSAPQKSAAVSASVQAALPAAVTAAAVTAAAATKTAPPSASPASPAASAPAAVPAAVPAPLKSAPVKPAATPTDESKRALAILDAKPDTKAKAAAENKSDKKSPTASSEPIVLQVAALATQERINEVQTKLKNAGIKTFTQKIATASGERTRIRISVANKEEAEKMRVRLVKLGLNGTLIQPGH